MIDTSNYDLGKDTGTQGLFPFDNDHNKTANFLRYMADKIEEKSGENQDIIVQRVLRTITDSSKEFQKKTLTIEYTEAFK